MIQRRHGRVTWDLSSILLVGVGLYLLTNISACSFFSQGRSVYDQAGIRIGLEADPSVRPSGEAGLNNHPINLSPKNLEVLLQPIQVSGYSGTIAGLLAKPQPVPLFTPQELSTISAHLATAFREAKSTERVSFSMPKPDVTYSEEHTVGALFFRGPYLHVVVTDHSSILRPNTGGGDYKDIRDTKGMKLWVAGPAQAAKVPDLEEPRWAHFEKVHVSLNVKEVEGLKERIPAARMNRGETGAPAFLPTAASPEVRQGSASTEELQLQIQELSGANQELRGRLDEQSRRMQQLQDQMEQLSRVPPQSDSKGKPRNAVPAH